MEIDAPGFIFTVTAFILGFSLLVFIHEWGHYSVARIFGVKIDSFSIGFGKEVIGRTDKHGVRWKICMIPLGGYVKFSGDRSAASAVKEGLDDLPADERKGIFHFKPLYQRALIVFAGPAINLITGILVFAVFYMVTGVQSTPPLVGATVEDGPAALAGLIEGDIILSVENQPVDRFSEISDIVKLHPGQEIDVTISRQGQQQTFSVKLDTRFLEDRFGNQYAFGVLGVFSSTPLVTYPGPVTALGEGVQTTVRTVKSIFISLGQMIIGVRSVSEAGGPVRIGAMMGDAASKGITNFVLLLALLSINLGVINLLPIPVLDGGHLFFYGVEALKGSPLNPKTMEVGYFVGSALMILLMVFVTLNDLHSIFL